MERVEGNAYILVHVYEGIEDVVVFKAVIEELPRIIVSLTKILSNCKNL